VNEFAVSQDKAPTQNSPVNVVTDKPGMANRIAAAKDLCLEALAVSAVNPGDKELKAGV